jgi:hypothetical protein
VEDSKENQAKKGKTRARARGTRYFSFNVGL